MRGVHVCVGGDLGEKVGVRGCQALAWGKCLCEGKCWVWSLCMWEGMRTVSNSWVYLVKCEVLGLEKALVYSGMW